MAQDPSPSPDNDPSPRPPKSSGLSAFWVELKRRKVMRVAITYAVVAWLLIQMAVTFSYVMMAIVIIQRKEESSDSQRPIMVGILLKYPLP